MKRMQMLAIVLSVLLTTLFSVNPASWAQEGNDCISIEKTANVDTAVPGDTIEYTITVTNCGSTDLTNLVVSDSKFGVLTEPFNLLCGDLSYEIKVDYDVPQDDCNKTLENIASVTGDGCYGPVSAISDTVTVDVICEAKCETDLIAGQDWESPAGVVTINEKDGNLIVKFETTDGWNLEATHLYVGTTMPKKAAPGQFPFSNQTGEYTVPLLDVECGTTLYIAAHAVVSKDGQWETAWADKYGMSFGKGKNWAMAIEYQVCFGCVEQP